MAMIQKTPNVCGGYACIRDTRIPVGALQRLNEIGRADEQLLEDYPTPTAADLAAAREYARQNATEVADAIRRPR